MVITLKQIYKDDQSDRIGGKKWRLILRNDKKRRAEVGKISISEKKLSASAIDKTIFVIQRSYIIPGYKEKERDYRWFIFKARNGIFCTINSFLFRQWSKCRK